MCPGADEQFAQTRARAVGDELLVFELGHPHPSPFRQAMPTRKHNHELLGEELLEPQSVALDPLGDGQECQIEFVVAQHLRELLA